MDEEVFLASGEVGRLDRDRFNPIRLLLQLFF